MQYNVKEILARTQGGRVIFEYYGVDTLDKKNSLSPLNGADTKPSFTVFFNEPTSKWRFKDFGESGLESTGDAIDFVQRKFALGFKDTLAKIHRDLHL
jgi:hypothetical protein